jgi:hypothetical protein
MQIVSSVIEVLPFEFPGIRRGEAAVGISLIKTPSQRGLALDLTLDLWRQDSWLRERTRSRRDSWRSVYGLEAASSLGCPIRVVSPWAQRALGCIKTA